MMTPEVLANVREALAVVANSAEPDAEQMLAAIVAGAARRHSHIIIGNGSVWLDSCGYWHVFHMGEHISEHPDAISAIRAAMRGGK